MTRSLKQIALVVTCGTLISKIGGLTRQLVIAGAFGVGAAYDAYNYAYVLPGFFLILLGGINGPFHNSIVSVLSRKTKKEGAYILSVINTFVSALLIFITAIILLAADPLISIIGPGLAPDIHQIAVMQLKFMAPITLLSGFIGLGFGSLNANDEFLIPAISPFISSLIIIIFVGGFWLYEDSILESNKLEIIGGIILGIATLIGAFLQWIIQIPTLISKGLTRLNLVWDLRHPGVREVMKIIGPATLASGMLQINVFTDLFFASEIVGAAAGLSYANFLVQAPLGLISNGLLIPLIPTFSKLTNPNDRENLISRIRQGIMLSSASMIILGAILIALAMPIVTLVYARGAFETNATKLVAELLIAYGVGMPTYLGRDLLVRVFYALGDGVTPFRLSAIGIVLNIFFDWFLVGGPSPWGNQLSFNFGATGLVLATVAINLITCLALLMKLNSRLGGLPLNEWALDGLKLLFAGVAAGFIAWSISSVLNWPNEFLSLLIEVSLSISTSLFVFFLLGTAMNVKEVKELIILIRQRIIRL